MSKKTTPCYDYPFFNYQKYWESRAYENQSEKIALKKLLSLIPSKKSKKIVDIAGGFGRLTPEYAPSFKKSLLVEPSEKLLQETQKLQEKYKNFTVKKTSIEKLPISNQSFDVALLIRVLHHLKDPEVIIKEINRILRPKGFLILEFANKAHLKNRLKALSCMNLKFLMEHKPKDITQKRKTPPFLNYHPNQIKTLLLSNGFKIVSHLSVSNLRHSFFKKLIPFKILLLLEKRYQEISATLNTYLAPSIFILAKKNK